MTFEELEEKVRVLSRATARITALDRRGDNNHARLNSLEEWRRRVEAHIGDEDRHMPGTVEATQHGGPKLDRVIAGRDVPSSATHHGAPPMGADIGPKDNGDSLPEAVNRKIGGLELAAADRERVRVAMVAERDQLNARIVNLEKLLREERRQAEDLTKRVGAFLGTLRDS